MNVSIEMAYLPPTIAYVMEEGVLRSSATSQVGPAGSQRHECETAERTMGDGLAPPQGYPLKNSRGSDNNFHLVNGGEMVVR